MKKIIRYTILAMIFFIATCAPQEPPKRKFEAWNIEYGMCSGYLGQYQGMMQVHYRLKMVGLRSDSYIYRGVKYW